jgi:hypothetical protein
MSDYVDFKQKEAYHQNELELISFITKKLSKRFLLDKSYMPYEFTIIIYKNEYINNEKSVYSEELL